MFSPAPGADGCGYGINGAICLLHYPTPQPGSRGLCKQVGHVTELCAPAILELGQVTNLSWSSILGKLILLNI